MTKVLACILLITAFIACSKKDTKLIAEIGEHPVGGTNIEELDCTVVGRLFDGETPINAIIEWWWSDSTGNNEQAVAQGSYEFTDEVWEEYTTIIEAPIGYYFFQYFWVKVTWQNEDEGEHEIESDRAWCDIDTNLRNAYPVIEVGQ